MLEDFDNTNLVDLKGHMEKGDSSNALASYINFLISISLSLGFFTAVAMIIYGGVKYTTSETFTGKLAGKDEVQRAVGALLLFFASFVVFNSISPELLKVRFKPVAIKANVKAEHLKYKKNHSSRIKAISNTLSEEGLNQKIQTSSKAGCEEVRQKKLDKGLLVTGCACLTTGTDSYAKEYSRDALNALPNKVVQVAETLSGLTKEQAQELLKQNVKETCLAHYIPEHGYIKKNLDRYDRQLKHKENKGKFKISLDKKKECEIMLSIMNKYVKIIDEFEKKCEEVKVQTSRNWTNSSREYFEEYRNTYIISGTGIKEEVDGGAETDGGV